MALPTETPSPGAPRGGTRRLRPGRPGPAPRPAPWDAPTTPGAPRPTRFRRQARRDPPRLPGVPRAVARWRAPAAAGTRAALLDRARTLAAAAGAALGLDVRLADLVPAPAVPALAGARIAVSPGPGLSPWTVRLCPHTVSAIVGAVTGTAAPVLATEGDRVTAAVLGHGLLVALGAVAGTGPASPALAAAPGGPPVLCFDARLDLGGARGRVQVCLDAAGAARLDPLAVATGADLPPALAAVPVTLTLCAGPVRLARATLDCLEPGDAVCPDPALAFDGAGLAGPAFLAAGAGAAALGLLEDGALTVEAFRRPTPRHREVPMPAPPPTDALEVDVRVVLATVPATLGELAALEPGSVVPLPAPDREARLLVGETVVARGTLVDVDGRLGVQVVATAAGGEP